MFQDEAGFGRISDPVACWAPPKERPSVPSQLIREYKTVYGAVCPETGDAFYQVYQGSNKDNMSDFLKALSERFPEYIILLVLDNASWHMTQEQNSQKRRKNKDAIVEFKTPEMLFIPDNIRIVHLPPRTPELNPIEIIWREIRKRGFKNIIFNKLKDVVDKFFEVVKSMSKHDVISITRWSWVDKILRQVF